MNQRNQILTFGKYKGMTVEQISNLNPSYLLWLNKNKIQNFELNDYYYFKCIEDREDEYDRPDWGDTNDDWGDR